MDGFREVVKVSQSAAQNAQLEAIFRDFYKISRSPRISKDLFVEKASYQRFLNGKMRERTPYEAAKPFSTLNSEADLSSLAICHAKISFIFPSGRTITLTDYLDEPNGLTKEVALLDTDGSNLTFKSYIHAEAEVVERFLAASENGVLVGNS